MPSIEQQDDPSDSGSARATPRAGECPTTIDAMLEEIDREFARSILRCEPDDEWQERLGGMIGRYQAAAPDVEDLVFRVDRLMIEHGSPPWSIERRGLVAVRPPRRRK